jgi:hypothetical protein
VEESFDFSDSSIVVDDFEEDLLLMTLKRMFG